MSKEKKTNEFLFNKYLKSGKANVKKRKLSRGLRDFSKAIELKPKSAEAYFNRGIVYELLKKEKNAMKDYNEVIELDPNFAHVYVHRAFLYAELKKHDHALQDLRKAYELDPKFELTYFINAGNLNAELKRYKQALECYNKALELKSKKSVQVGIYVNRAIVYSLLKEYTKALNNCDQATKLNPESALVFLNKGVIYSKLRQYDKALENFEKATRLQPNYTLAHMNKGIIHRQMGQTEKALDAFKYAIELQPKNTGAYFQLALTYEQLGQFDKALEEYDKILAINPKYAHAYTHRGIIFGNFCEYDEAFRNLSEAIKLDSKEIVAYLNRAIGYTEIGNYDLALKDLEMTIKLDPSFDLAYLEKGEVLCYLAEEKASFKARKKYYQEIIGSFRKASQITKDSALKRLCKWWIEFSKKYCDASAESKKRLKVFAQLYEDSLDAKLFTAVLDEQDRFSKFMSMSKTFPESECFLQILRRWNSFTPVVPGKSRANLGGGYFLACDGQGIVIDPGYNFIENFIKNDFSLGDISNIVLTHAHDDHTADFEAILSLFSKSKKNKEINLFTNLGASVKFSHLIAKNEPLIRKVEMLNENETYQITPNLAMKATKAIHNDILTDTSSKGLIFELKRGPKKYKLGITSDTMFFTNANNGNGLYSLYDCVDVLILHIGSMHRKEFESMEDNFETHKYDGEHLGIRGVINLIVQCRPKLAIISEFGEELKELRAKIAHRVDNVFENYDSTASVRVIPGDIGLKVVLDGSIKVKCEVCGTLVELEDVKYTETLINHKIAYHCRDHKRTEVIDTFKKEEEKELRIRAESMGCGTDLFSPTSHVAKPVDRKTV